MRKEYLKNDSQEWVSMMVGTKDGKVPFGKFYTELTDAKGKRLSGSWGDQPHYAVRYTSEQIREESDKRYAEWQEAYDEYGVDYANTNVTLPSVEFLWIGVNKATVYLPVEFAEWLYYEMKIAKAEG